MRNSISALTIALCIAAAPALASDVKTGSAPSVSVGQMASKKAGKSGIAPASQTLGTVSELTEQECTRLGGVVTSGVPNDSTCKTNTRCKTTLANGDIRSICIDEVAQ